MEKYYCDTCLKKQDTKVVDAKRIFTHKSKSIEIEAKERVCSVCEEVVYDEQLDQEMVSMAIHAYNKVHGLTGEDIISFRKRYKLSQELFSKLLGIAKKTLISYEKEYVIPEESNSSLLKLVVKDPSALFTLSKDKNISLDKKHLELLKSTDVADETKAIKSHSFIKNSILFLAKNELSMTRLMKAFFYLDFSYCKKNQRSLTGLTYFKYEYGPFTATLYQYVDELIKEGKLEKSIIKYKDTLQSMYKSKVAMNNLDVSEEVDILLANIKGFIQGNNAHEISELSHQEEAWIKTPIYEPISYDYAKTLKIDFSKRSI